VAALLAAGDLSEVYAPCHTIVSVIRGQRVARDVPWLGAIVLGKWDGSDLAAWHRIRRTPGVIGIIGGASLASIRDSDVERTREWTRSSRPGGRASR
jgi:transcription antitermination factor NusG